MDIEIAVVDTDSEAKATEPSLNGNTRLVIEK